MNLKDSFFVTAMNYALCLCLQNQGNKGFYIGMTSNLKRRIQEHKEGKGGRTTKLKKNWKLIYFEGYLNKHDAIGREKFLKGDSGRKYLKRQLENYLV